jgi:hypothetical protein
MDSNRQTVYVKPLACALLLPSTDGACAVPALPMNDDDIFGIYAELWKRAEAEGAYVSYQGANVEMAGYFVPNDPPNIAIYRPYYHSPPYAPSRHRIDGAPLGPPDLMAELCTLAHEYGHFRSYLDSVRHPTWLKYHEAVRAREAIEAAVRQSAAKSESTPALNNRLRAAIVARLEREQIELIIDEETLAWALGRDTLIALGFTDLAYYDERTRMGVHNYRYRLAIDDLWPEDSETVASRNK